MMLHIFELLSVIVAVAALVVAVWAHFSQKNLAKEIQRVDSDTSRTIAAAHVKPLIAIIYSNYESYISLEMKNFGMGTAIIDDLKFSAKSTTAESIASFVQKGDANGYEYYKTTDAGEIYLPVGESLKLIHVSGGAELDQRRIELGQVNIEISYKDLFGNRQPVTVRVGS